MNVSQDASKRPVTLPAALAMSEPASEQTVLAVEERLGVRLPPMYRNFLLTSNGWNCIGELDLLKAEEIGWFAEREAWLLDSWSGPGLELSLIHI